MKTIHKINDTKQFPQFWTEEWLEAAINELDTRAMTPEERLAYEMTLSANALAISNEKKKIDKAKLAVKAEMARKMLESGLLNTAQIAEMVGMDEKFINMLIKK